MFETSVGRQAATYRPATCRAATVRERLPESRDDCLAAPSNPSWYRLIQARERPYGNIRHPSASSPRRAGCLITVAVLALCSLMLTATAIAQSPGYGIGRSPTADEIKAWSISAFPDGKGLPASSGTAVQGKDVYERRCAECHGNDGEGGDHGPLVGGQGSLKTPKPLKTVVSYWPYATTLWDYTNRSMPFDTPGVLSNDQLYAVVAYVLFLGGIVGENDVMDAKTLPEVKMPNRDGFVAAGRPDTGSSTRTMPK